jgi:adenylosuccinate lyase
MMIEPTETDSRYLELYEKIDKNRTSKWLKAKTLKGWELRVENLKKCVKKKSLMSSMHPENNKKS